MSESWRIEPVGDKVVVKRDEVESTIGRIYIPESAREEKHVATVLAVGPRVERIRPGDRVLVGKYAGEEVEFNGNPVTFVTSEDIHMIIEDDPTSPIEEIEGDETAVLDQSVS